jgi:WD40 repeat protein
MNLPTTAGHGTPDGAVPYPSFVALKDAHASLLHHHRQHGETPETLAHVDAFIRQGAATGSLLDVEHDRQTAQSLLDYWVTMLYRSGATPPDAVLDEYDPALAPVLDESACPYVGLTAFNEEHQDRFFGRSGLIATLLARLAMQPCVAVLGPSGSGKSSLVLGGLLPRLRAGALPSSETWTYLPCLVPGPNPLRSLALAVKPAGIASAQWVAEHVPLLRSDATHLAQLLAAHAPGTAVLVVDQFEETFTLCTDDGERGAFIENLVRLVDDPAASHRVIVTLRTDFESHLVRVPSIAPWFQSGEVRVTPLTSTELREVIEEPARRVGLRFEDGVVDELVRDILGEPAGLPLLQFTLCRLWKAREGNRVTLKAYRALNGARGALALTADEFFERLIYQDQETARRILLRLARPSEGLEVTSNRVTRSALYMAGEATDQVDRVLTKLVAAGLVRLTPGDTPGDDQVEVAHEALIRNWPRLVGWLEDERASLRQRLRLTAAADQWLMHGRDPESLLRGAALDEASRHTDLNVLESEYLDASRAAQERAQREREEAAWREVEHARSLAEATREERRTRQHAQRMAGAVAVLVLLLGVAGAGWYQVAGQMRVASSRELSSHAIRQLDTDPQLSLLLAIQAESAASTGESAEALRQALDVVRDYRILRGHDGRVWKAAFVGDGKSIVTAGADGTLRLWSADGETPHQVLNGHTAVVHDFAVSRDGLHLASEAADGTARLWDLRTGQSLHTLEGLRGQFATLDFSPDATWLAAEGSLESDGEGLVAVWDRTSGQRVTTLAGHAGQISVVRFSPDGRWLLTAGDEGTVRVWSAPTWRLHTTLADHQAPLNDVVFSADGTRVATASDDGRAIVWETSTWRAGAILQAGQDGQDAVSAVALSADGQRLVTGLRRRTPRSLLEVVHAPTPGSFEDAFDASARASRMGTARAAVWSVDTGIKIADLNGHRGAVYAVALSPNASLVVTAGADATARLWDAATGVELAVLRGHSGQVYSATFAPSGAFVLTAGEDGTARLWDATRLDVLGEVSSGTQGTARVAFTADGRRIVAANWVGAIGRWDVEGLEFVDQWSREDEDPYDIAFSRDGSRVITGSRYPRSIRPFRDGTTEDSDARVWDVATGALVAELEGHEGPVHHVALSEDGEQAATAVGRLVPSRAAENAEAEYPVRIWRPGTATPLHVLKGHTQRITSLEFAADGRLLYSASEDGTARAWSTADGSAQLLLQADGPLVHAIPSADGRTVLTSGVDGSAVLWDVSTESRRALLRGHTAPIVRGAFSADGRLALTASADGTVRIWEAASGEPVTELRGPDGTPVWSAAFSPDGRRVVGGNANGRVRLFSCEVCLPSDQLLRIARTRVTRALSPQERQQYLHERVD